WWSLAMSGSDGTFTRTIPQIDINFDNLHSSQGIGVIFGYSDYCTEFDVTWYNGDTQLAYKSVSGNTLQEVNVEVPVENYNKISIRFLKTRRPYRYVRLMEIGFGLEEVFEGDIVSAKIVEELDPSGAVLS